MSKREQILDVAERLFNEFGYTAVGVDLIRDTAQVSKTSMYRHFGSKNQLIEAVLERRHQRWEASLNAALEVAGSTGQPELSRLDAILDWHFDWFKQPDFKGCMFMHALAEFKQVDEAISAKAIHHKAWLRSLLQEELGSATQDQEFRVESLMTLIEGMIVRMEFGEFSDREVYRRAAHLLLQA